MIFILNSYQYTHDVLDRYMMSILIHMVPNVLMQVYILVQAQWTEIKNHSSNGKQCHNSMFSWKNDRPTPLSFTKPSLSPFKASTIFIPQILTQNFSNLLNMQASIQVKIVYQKIIQILTFLFKLIMISLLIANNVSS